MGRLLSAQSQHFGDASEVSLMFQLADQLKAADKTLGLIKLGRATFDTLMDRQVYPSDLSALAREIEVIADCWQGEIDAAPAEPETCLACDGTGQIPHPDDPVSYDCEDCGGTGELHHA